jgi:tetratricopeptide (TPR) repeat protein
MSAAFGLRRETCFAGLLTLAGFSALLSGCASLKFPHQPVEEVSEKRIERTEDALSDFETRRDQAQYYAAISYWERADYQGCEETLKSLLRRNPEHRDSRLLLGDLYQHQNRPRLALSQLQEALNRYPEDPQVLEAMALMLETQGNQQGAQLHHQQAALMTPRGSDFGASAQHREQLAQFEHRPDGTWSDRPKSSPGVELVSHDPLNAESGPQRLTPPKVTPAKAASPKHKRYEEHPALKAAEQQFQRRDVEAAQAILEQATQSEPADLDLAASAALLCLRYNHPNRAIDLLGPAVEADIPHPRVLRTLGIAHYRAGDYAASQVALEQALSLDRASALTYFLLGLTLERQGQVQASQQVFEQAEALDPRFIRTQ